MLHLGTAHHLYHSQQRTPRKSSEVSVSVTKASESRDSTKFQKLPLTNATYIIFHKLWKRGKPCDVHVYSNFQKMPYWEFHSHLTSSWNSQTFLLNGLLFVIQQFLETSKDISILQVFVPVSNQREIKFKIILKLKVQYSILIYTYLFPHVNPRLLNNKIPSSWSCSS